MVHRRSVEKRNATRPVDRMESIQGDAVLKSYRHGDHYFDVDSGLHWSIERESARKFLARVYKPNSDDVIVIERTDGILACYKHGEDQSHPVSLGADSPEFRLLESKMRYPQLLSSPHLWKRLA